MRSKEAIKAAQERYNKKQYTFVIRFDKEKDSDILDRLSGEESKQAFIKSCIRYVTRHETTPAEALQTVKSK